MHAGSVQMAHFGAADLRVDKKGTIDLVTEHRRGDRARVPRADRRTLPRPCRCSARSSSRPGSAIGSRSTAGCSIRSTAPPTTRTACRSSAARWRSRSAAYRLSRAVFDPNRQELFTAERGQGAWLNGKPMKVSAADDADRFAAGHRLPLQRAARSRRADGLFTKFITRRAGGAAAGVGGARPLLRRGGAVRGLLGTEAPPVGRRRRRAAGAGGGRRA